MKFHVLIEIEVPDKWAENSDLTTPENRISFLKQTGAVTELTAYDQVISATVKE